MKSLLIILAVLAVELAGCPARAQIAGKLDLASKPAYGAWQSVESTDQAIGLTKHLWTLSKDAQPLVNVGIFAGASKPMLSEPAAPLRPLGGVTVAIPGSLLDYALGTKWGDTWAPRLKTGLLLADDFTRPSQLHLRPTFVGVGITYR